MVMTTKSVRGITRSPDPTPSLPTVSACQKAVRLIIDSHKRVTVAKCERAAMLAAFFDSKLPSVWKRANGEPIDTPDKGYRYFATAMGVTTSRIARYVQWGRSIEVTRIKTLPERVSRELTDAKKQCPEKLPDIMKVAYEVSKQRYKEAGWDPSNAKVNASDTREALSPHVTVEPPLPTPALDPHAVLKKAVGAAMQAAQQVDDPGAEVYTALLNIWNKL